jgi:hypothetical protein
MNEHKQIDWDNIKNPINESCYELLYLANRDIRDITSQIKDEDKPDDEKNSKASYLANQVAEKLIKAFIKNCGKEVPYGHNLLTLLDGATFRDSSLNKLYNDCSFLEGFSGERYNMHSSITNENLRDVIKSVKTIYLFDKINILYDKHSDEKLKKLPNNYFDKMLEQFNYSIIKNEIKPINCMDFKYFEKYDPNKLILDGGILIEHEKIKGVLPEESITGYASKKIYEDDSGKHYFFLERIFKNASDKNFRSDLFTVENDFTPIDAFVFIKQNKLKIKNLTDNIIKQKIDNKEKNDDKCSW